MDWSDRPPLVLAVCGLVGTGKSHLARELRRVSGLEVLNSDAVRKELADESGDRDDLYGERFNALTYEELGRRARAELERGRGAIVDATFRRRDDRASFARGLGDMDVEPLYVRCVAPEAVRRERLIGRPERDDAKSDATIEVLERQEFEAGSDIPGERMLELSTDQPMERAVAEIEAWLAERG